MTASTASRTSPVDQSSSPFPTGAAAIAATTEDALRQLEQLRAQLGDP
jgi:hypothetical protein